MKNFVKILSLVAFAFIFVFSLQSCKKTDSFYNEFKDAGADIDKDNCFDVIKVSDAKQMKENNESFVLLLGTSKSSSCVNQITQIQEEVDYLGYEGSILFINIKNILKKSDDIKSAAKSLGIKSDSIKEGSLICVIYSNGAVVADSNDKDGHGEFIKKFIVDSEDSFSYVALVDFIYESEVYSRL